MNQLPNEDFVAITGVVLFIVHYYKIPFADNEVVGLLSALLTIGGILVSHYKQVKAGNSTPLGFAKI